MVAGVWSDDGALQLEATTQFRKLLSIGMILVLLQQRMVLLAHAYGKIDSFDVDLCA